MAIDYDALNATILALPTPDENSVYTPVDITGMDKDVLHDALVQETKVRFPDDDHAGTYNQPAGTPKIKVDLSGDTVDPTRYDRVVNVGALSAVVDAVRADTP